MSLVAIESGKREYYREHPIHVLRLDGVPHLFDIEALGHYGMGYADTSSAVFRIPAAFKRRFTAKYLSRHLAGFQTFHHVYWLVSEPGLAFLAEKSILAGARPFMDWARTTIFDRYRVPQVEETTPPTEVLVMPQDDPDKTDVFDDDFPPPDDDDDDDDESTDTTDVEEEEEYGKERSDYPEIQVQTIPFYGKNGLQAGWHDGDVWVNFRRICDDLGLQCWGQIKRLKRQAWGTTSMMDAVAADGIKRPIVFIPRRILPMWLATVQASRCAESVRPLVIRYQLEVMDVLVRHFFPLPQPTGQSLDVAEFGRLIGESIGVALKPVADQVRMLVTTQEVISDRLRNLEDSFFQAESKQHHVNIDALYGGRWLTLREWADEHRYEVSGEHAQDWGMHMRNLWIYLGLKIERRVAQNGKATNVYPETAIQKFFNCTCPREVWIDRRSGDGSAQAGFHFRNGHSPV
jgi:hypothetical protein